MQSYSYSISALDVLEAEAIHELRETGHPEGDTARLRERLNVDDADKRGLLRFAVVGEGTLDAGKLKSGKRYLVADDMSRADLAVLDSPTMDRKARRDAFLCSLFGVPRIVVAEHLRSEFEQFAARLGFASVAFMPIEPARLVEHLETVYIGGDRNLVDLRMPVQLVFEAGGARWLAGQIGSGVVKVGDEVVVVPSHKRSRVRAIRIGERQVDHAFAPLSVAVELEDDVGAARGAVLAHSRNVPRAVRELEAMVVWTGERPLERGRVYRIKHGASSVRASCVEVGYRIDPETLHRAGGASLAAGDIGRAHFTLFEERFVDPYKRNRATGGFLVIDPETGRTAGTGMIVDRETEHERLEREAAAKRHVIVIQGKVSGRERARLLGQSAATIWLTGLSGSGKSTLATELERQLIDAGRACYMLDGDNIRAGINRDLGFGAEDRRENIRRIAEVARLMNDAGLVTVTAFISPYRADRDMARQIIGPERFIEVYVAAPIEVCEKRDPKGLYAKARKGEIPEFTGVSAPYEAPEKPDVVVDTAKDPVEECVRQLLDAVLGKTRL